MNCKRGPQIVQSGLVTDSIVTSDVGHRSESGKRAPNAARVQRFTVITDEQRRRRLRVVRCVEALNVVTQDLTQVRPNRYPACLVELRVANRQQILLEVDVGKGQMQRLVQAQA